MRRGLKEQTLGAVAVAEAGVRRTDLEIVDSVKRMYFGAVLAVQIHDVGKDTLARMEATLRLTESLYKEGTGTVKKTDYLDNRVMVETLRSAIALLDKNRKISRAALANTMGYRWDVSVIPTAEEIAFNPFRGNLADLVSAAYEMNPDWATIEAAITAGSGKVRESRSGHYPRVAFTGSLNYLWNDYEFGIATAANKENSMVGIMIDFPLFDGFMTNHRVIEAKARLRKLKEERILLREGIGLRVRDLFLDLEAAQNRYDATLDAMRTSEENRDLNVRAYQNELVETEDVIRAQLMEAFMAAQHYRVRYDHAAKQSELSLVVGSEIRERLNR